MLFFSLFGWPPLDDLFEVLPMCSQFFFIVFYIPPLYGDSTCSSLSFYFFHLFHFWNRTLARRNQTKQAILPEDGLDLVPSFYVHGIPSR